MDARPLSPLSRVFRDIRRLYLFSTSACELYAPLVISTFITHYRGEFVSDSGSFIFCISFRVY